MLTQDKGFGASAGCESGGYKYLFYKPLRRKGDEGGWAKSQEWTAGLDGRYGRGSQSAFGNALPHSFLVKNNDGLGRLAGTQYARPQTWPPPGYSFMAQGQPAMHMVAPHDFFPLIPLVFVY